MRATLLFVDDAEALDMFARTYERTHKVLTADSKMGALELLRTNSVDLVLADYKFLVQDDSNLPLAARKAGLEIETIALVDEKTATDQLLVGGAFCSVTKPWAERELSTAIKNALAFRHLRLKLQRAERLVECMADGIIFTDTNNEIVELNQAARELLRIDTVDKAHTKYLWEVLGFYPFELVRGWELGCSQILREEVSIFDRTLTSIVSPVTNLDGELDGVLVVLRDITEQKAAEERREESVSIISHELRTPLTAISSALDLVTSRVAGDLNDKQSRFLEIAKESADKLNAMVDDLLDLSKFAKGKMAMCVEPVFYDALVRNAIERYSPAALKKQISITARLPNEPIGGSADPVRIAQVLNNLLANSIKFCADEGRIELELSSSDIAQNYAVLTCWNDGEPILEAELEQIFTKFEQGSPVRARAVRGTGLGLAICRSIVEAHGGRIWAEHTFGNGARFVFLIPTNNSEPCIDDVSERHFGLADNQQPITGLVIAKAPSAAYLFKALLLDGCQQVFVAHSANEAIALARKHSPNIIGVDMRATSFGAPNSNNKIDIGMRGKEAESISAGPRECGANGFSALEWLRREPNLQGSKIIVLSNLDERDAAIRAGASAFFRLPVSSSNFEKGKIDSKAMAALKAKLAELIAQATNAKLEQSRAPIHRVPTTNYPSCTYTKTPAQRSLAT